MLTLQVGNAAVPPQMQQQLAYPQIQGEAQTGPVNQIPLAIGTPSTPPVEETHKHKQHSKHHGPHIHINHKALNGFKNAGHALEDVAASGALGPAAQGVAVAAKSTEAMVDAGLHGGSAEDVLKAGAKTAAGAALENSPAGQLAVMTAGTAGVPVSTVTGGIVNSNQGGPGALTGGPAGSMKTQLQGEFVNVAINQATHMVQGQQAMANPTGTTSTYQQSQQTQPNQIPINQQPQIPINQQSQPLIYQQSQLPINQQPQIPINQQPQIPINQQSQRPINQQYPSPVNQQLQFQPQMNQQLQTQQPQLLMPQQSNPYAPYGVVPTTTAG